MRLVRRWLVNLANALGRACPPVPQHIRIEVSSGSAFLMTVRAGNADRFTARHYFADRLQADDDLEALALALLQAAASAVAVTAGAWLAAGFVMVFSTPTISM